MKYLFVFAALLAALFCHSQEEKSLLWKITGNGLKEASYLYGTIHMTCDATLDQSTLQALKNTKQLYLEMDMDDPNLQASMMAGMPMKAGVTLKSLLSENDFKILDTSLQEKFGFTATMMNTFKPFVLSAMFLPSMLDCPMQSVEGELMKVATEQKEETLGLETAQEQMAVFDAIPYKVQLDELMASIKDNFVNDKIEMQKMYEVYKTKDINALLTLSSESENALTSDYQDVLLNNRNKNWISKIEMISKEKATFYGVGAAHLAGENGVIALLRKKGYQVEPIR